MEKDDLYVLALPDKKLSSTNKIWNQMKLNHPWILGSASTLIGQRDFQTKEEWRDYYFETGHTRLRLLEEVKESDYTAYTRLTSIENYNFFSCKEGKHTRLNTAYGRTPEELNSIGDILYGGIKATGNPAGLTRKECHYLVLYRLLGETWNGIQKRERNTVITMKNVLGSEYSVTSTDGKIDTLYEVDAEVYHQDKLVAGVQIKPLSYKNHFDGKEDVLALNKAKNDAYTEDMGAPVFYIYAKTDGSIYNAEVLADIHKLTQTREMEAV